MTDSKVKGVAADISLDGHYIGETVTYKSMMSCAGRWVGGCGGLSEYTIEVTYK